MPIQYSGIIEEHVAVRTAVGLFDLSHMGEFRVTGNDAVAAIDRLTTNDIAGLQPGEVRYTPMCRESGGIVDDVLVYRFQSSLMLVVNASNIDKDLDWVCAHIPAGVPVDNISDETALIAVQGPQSEQLLLALTDMRLTDLKYYRFQEGTVSDVSCIVSRTGYTGEDGFELYAQAQDAPELWRALLLEGVDRGIRPVGLGARDTLRLEAGLMLYGNDIDDSTSPYEAGLGWTVKLGSTDFMGRSALEQERQDGPAKRMVAFEMLARGIPRPHMQVRVHNEPVGEVTSGTFSPTLQRGIGLAYVTPENAEIGTELNVVVRNHVEAARVVRRPIYKREGAK